MSAIDTAHSTLRTLLANHAAFRTWSGAADVAAALAQIFIGGFEEGSEPTKPYLLIRSKEDTFQLTKLGVDTRIASGELLVIAEKEIGSANQADSVLASAEKDGDWGDLIQIIGDASIEEASGVRMIVRDITIEADAAFPAVIEGGDPSKRYEEWFGVINVAWGPDAD